MNEINISGLNKTFFKNGQTLKVLDNISMSLNKNEFVSVVGPSGCGKSTLLRSIAGLIPVDSGIINASGKVSYLQQSGPLMPWRNVYENVSLPVEIRNGKKNRSNPEITGLIKEFGLEGFEKHMPGEISGGMAKRVALLRTYLEDKDILLLDEPFSALDAITRKLLQQWLLNIWYKHRKGVIFVTHDIEEALFLSDKIYIMGQRPGRIMDCLIPEFPRPRSYDIVYSGEFIAMKKQVEKILLDNS